MGALWKQTLEGGVEIRSQRCRRQRAGGRKRTNDHTRVLRQPTQAISDEVPKAPPNRIASHRTTHGSTDDEPDSRAGGRDRVIIVREVGCR